MKKEQLEAVIKGEWSAMLDEVKEKSADIEKKLETLRKKLETEGALVKYESLGDEMLGGSRPHRRLDIKTVSELIDCPINELMLYFIRNYKNQNERKLVEYHIGQCHFYQSN